MRYLLLALTFSLLFLSPDSLHAMDDTSTQFPHFATQAIALTALALFPFIIIILTGFVKIAVCLALLRNALGAQQAPPNQVINGIAFILSLYIIFPTALQMYQVSEGYIYSQQAPKSVFSPDSADFFIKVASVAKEPYRDYVLRNIIPAHQKSFYRMLLKMMPEEFRADINPKDFMVIIPAYITTQIKVAFEIGVLVYIPFFVIDLVTSNILLAMGMMMLSPVTISMPLKLFLVVMIDGWTLLIQGLVTTFK